MPFHPKKRPRRTIPPPSGVDWDSLCDLLGIQSMRDLARTVELAKLLPDIELAMQKFRPEEHRELLRLDRQVRWLALRRWQGNLDDPVLPPNTLRDLEALPALLALSYSRLCSWYVQSLISQIHSWGMTEPGEQRERARELVEKVGKAIVLSAGRGRPPCVVTPEDALRTYEDYLQRVKKVWRRFVSARRRVLRQALAREFTELGEHTLPPEDFLCSAEATPTTVNLRITAGHLLVSVRHLEGLLARARQARNSPDSKLPQ